MTLAPLTGAVVGSRPSGSVWRRISASAPDAGLRCKRSRPSVGDAAAVLRPASGHAGSSRSAAVAARRQPPLSGTPRARAASITNPLMALWVAAPAAGPARSPPERDFSGAGWRSQCQCRVRTKPAGNSPPIDPQSPDPPIPTWPALGNAGISRRQQPALVEIGGGQAPSGISMGLGRDSDPCPAGSRVQPSGGRCRQTVAQDQQGSPARPGRVGPASVDGGVRRCFRADAHR